MPEFKATGIPYLVRRASGVYYWQVKIGGHSRRGSLRTKKKATAKGKLFLALKAAQDKWADESIGQPGVRTLEVVLDEWWRRQSQRPDLKRSTVDEYGHRVRKIKATLDAEHEVATVTDDMVREWWARVPIAASPRRANSLLRTVSLVFEMAVDEGWCGVNPAKGLKKIPVGRKMMEMPTAKKFRKIVKAVRAEGTESSLEAVDMIEWLAYSGMRVGELVEMTWADVSAKRLIVRGGEDGTKNRQERNVPIIGALKKVIKRRRSKGATGRVFEMNYPNRYLTKACKAAGVRHMRVHDLRHLFATTCIEAGVDIPTVATWLGHQDGGALAMKTYAHVRERHSFAQADKVRFG